MGPAPILVQLCPQDCTRQLRETWSPLFRPAPERLVARAMCTCAFRICQRRLMASETNSSPTSSWKEWGTWLQSTMREMQLTCGFTLTPGNTSRWELNHTARAGGGAC